MSATKGASKRSTKTKKEPVMPSKTKKTDAGKKAGKEKLQLVVEEQITITKIVDDNDDALKNTVNRIKEITKKTEEEVVGALHDFNNDQDLAISYLLENNESGVWKTVEKKNRGSNVDNPEVATNHNDSNENSENWNNKDGNSAVPSRTYPRNRGPVRGRRGPPRQSDRTTNNSKWRGRDNKENERNADGGTSNHFNSGNRDGNNSGEGRDFRGRSNGGALRRMVNGQPRPGRGARGGRGGRGSMVPRTFQNRDNRERGGFPHQIETWANPDTSDKKAGEFPSPEDWDNEEYTGSLADSKVFTPSAPTEVDRPSPVQEQIIIQSVTFVPETVSSVEMSLKDDLSSLPLLMDPLETTVLPNSIIPSMVVGSNQLSPAQTQYLKQFVQPSDSRKSTTAAAVVAAAQQHPLVSQIVQQKPQLPSAQQTSMIYNSALNTAAAPSTTANQVYSSPMSQSFPVISQSSFTPSVSVAQTSQSFASITISSQSYSASPGSSFQPSSSMPPAPAPYSGRTVEFTSSNYSDIVNSYNAAHGLSNNTTLPPHGKSHHSQSPSQSKVSVGQVNDVELPSTDPSINTAMKLLDVQFGASLEFTNSDNFDPPPDTGIDSVAVSVLSNKYSNPSIGQPLSNVNTSHPDISSINTFQATTQQKQSHSSSSAQLPSVLLQNKQLNANDSILSNENNLYPGQMTQNSRTSGIQELKNSSDVPTLGYGINPDTLPYQTPQQPAFPKSGSVPSSSYHQTSAPASTYSVLSYGPPTQVTTSTSVYSNQHANNTSFSVYGSGANSPVSLSIAAPTPQLQNSIYHNSSYPPTAVSSFQSYLSYPSSMLPPYQVSAGGLTQTPYLGPQYGGASLASLGAGVSYGAAPFHTNYGITSSIQTPVVTMPQSHKITSSSLNSTVASKDSQYDNIQAVSVTAVSSSNSISMPSVTSVTNSVGALSLSQSTSTSVTTSTTSSSIKVPSSSTGNKTMMPSMPPGVTPVIGPQYIMSQPLYPPTFVNYDELQYIQRGMHPHVPAGFVDMNFPGPQTNLSNAGRDALSVPFSSISDGRFSRPDNTTSPVPPSGPASLNQANTAPTHQQPLINPGLLQTYAAAAYIYPYQQYTAPIYQVAPTPTAGGHGSTNNALAAPPFPKGPTGYSSSGYPSQYDSLNSNQNSVSDYSSSSSKVSNNSGYSSTPQQPSKGSSAGGNTGVQNQNNSATNSADLSVNMYNKSHSALNKSYDKQSFHSGGSAPPFTIAGNNSSGTSGLGNTPGGNYPPQMYIPGVPPNGPHHMHQSQHHQQDGNDLRSSGAVDRNFFMPGNRSNYR